MAADDLSAPLGQNKRKAPSKLPGLLPKAIAGLLLLSILGIGVWTAVVEDPFGGEPRAIVATAPVVEAKASEGGAGPVSRHDGSASTAKVASAAAPAAAEPPPGGKTVNIIDGMSGKSQQVILPGSAGEAKAATGVEPKMLEKTRHGTIPRVAADGTRPATLFARPLKVAAKSDAPRIAIIVTGLGVSANATSEALTKLPGAVTFAFAPYANDVDKLVARARAEHEVLLQTPMEPFDYPDNDPGPQTLLTSLNADQNIDRLQYLMSRFQGYVGLTNYMGARFTASEASMAPVLREVGKRGLIFIDDGSSPRSLAGQMAGTANVPFAKADVLIDSVPTAVEIERALGRLEMIARDRGVAIGVSGASPAAIGRIAEWAKRVESRGIVLVPITAVAIKAKSS